MRSFLRTVGSSIAIIGSLAMPAGAQLIGNPSGGNVFPFGTAGSIYQQVYASSNFGTDARMISSIEFFLYAAGNLATGVYDIYLSTTSAAVDGLNTTNFDANRGGDNVLFGSFTLGGAAPSVLVFSGTPFLYDPNAGNLLVDFRIASTSPGGAAFKANNGDAGGVYSRAHNFGTGFAGFGLQTEFINAPVTATPEPASILLVATGFSGVVGFRRRRRRQMAE